MRVVFRFIVAVVTIVVGLAFLAIPWVSVEGLSGPIQVAMALGVGVCLVVAGCSLIKESEE